MWGSAQLAGQDLAGGPAAGVHLAFQAAPLTGTSCPRGAPSFPRLCSEQIAHDTVQGSSLAHGGWLHRREAVTQSLRTSPARLAHTRRHLHDERAARVPATSSTQDERGTSSHMQVLTVCQPVRCGALMASVRTELCWCRFRPGGRCAGEAAGRCCHRGGSANLVWAA